ncbi:MAG: transposase-like protein [Candidatus Deianiraeaceae bacterium]|jgi:transposase-like protein
MSFENLFELLENFSDEKKCIEFFTQLRFQNGVFCAHCGSVRKIHHFSDGKRHKCADCRQQFTIRIGTIFEDSRISLRKWFVALYLTSSHKKGISSYQLAKDIKVTQKTAWFILQRIQFMSQTNSFNKPLNGEVQRYENLRGKEINEAKKILAFEATKIAHGEKLANDALHSAMDIYEKSQVNTNMEEFFITNLNIVDVLVDICFAKSKAEAKKLINQNAVKIDKCLCSNIQHNVNDGSIIQVGKKRIVRLKIRLKN